MAEFSGERVGTPGRKMIRGWKGVGGTVTYPVRADEAGGNNLRYHIHEILRLLYDVVDFDEGGRLTDGRILDGELQRLHVRRHLVEVLEQLLLRRPGRHLVRELAHHLVQPVRLLGEVLRLREEVLRRTQRTLALGELVHREGHRRHVLRTGDRETERKVERERESVKQV